MTIIRRERAHAVLLTVLLSMLPSVPGMAQGKAGDAETDLTLAERAFLKGKQLRLGVDSARPPFEYIDEKGAYSGISAGFMEYCAKRLGVGLQPVPGLRVRQAIDKTKTDEIDMLPKVAWTPERAKHLLFTRPYATSPSVIITRKDTRFVSGLADLDGLKVGVLQGLAVEEVLKRDYPRLPLLPQPDLSTALRSLSAGRLDAFVDNLAAAYYHIEKLGLTNLKIAALTPYNQDFAFGVRKDWPLLASALDKTLAAMSDKEKAEIRGKWLEVRYHRTINWRIAGPIGALLALGVAFVLVWNRRLRAAVKERERSEKKISAMGDAMADALVMLDGQGKVMFWNRAAERLFGYSAEEARGMDFHQKVAPAELREKARAAMELFSRTGQGALFGAAIETAAVDRAGRTFPVEVNLSPFQVDEERFSVGTVRDLTERKKADALKVEKSVAEEAAARAEEARQEAERFNRLALGREARIIALKKRANALALKAGEAPCFKDHELAAGRDEPAAQAQAADPEPGQKPAAQATLAEMLDLETFQKLMTDFCEAVGIASAIIDLKGEVIASARWQRACVDFHRKNEGTCARCLESDTDLALKLKQGKPFSIYRCKNGLTDAASPIIVDGRHVANAFAGQFFTRPPDREFFRRQAEEFGLEAERYLEAIAEVPVIAESKLEPILGYLVGLAQAAAKAVMGRRQAQEAEALLAKRVEDLKRERASAMSLAEDAEQSRLEIEKFKKSLELLVEERTYDLRASESRIKRILETTSQGYWFVDNDQRTIEVNPALCAILGRTSEEILGKTIYDFVDEENRRTFQAQMELRKKGKATHYEICLSRPDGSQVPVLIFGTPFLDEAGRKVGTFAMITDISDRKQAEKDLEERMGELERFSRLTINREEKMIQLKEEINALRERMGQGKKYRIAAE